MASRFVARFMNRNPRNNEMLGRQAPNLGYQFEQDREAKSFIYKVELVEGKAHREGRLVHFQDGIVLSASTREPGISSQLYSKVDTSASMNIGRILAMRCIKSGIHFAVPAVPQEIIAKSQHQSQFYKALTDEGLKLEEPQPEEHNYENDNRFPWRRYEQKPTRQEKLDG